MKFEEDEVSSSEGASPKERINLNNSAANNMRMSERRMMESSFSSNQPRRPHPLVFSSEDMNSSFSANPLNKYTPSSAGLKSLHPRSSAKRMGSGSHNRERGPNYYSPS
mmetsp:Transcript_40449/g.61703  ORF Transcript_40449/g.61703 Transcript_40449/m.61703 type:complete len:109 (+) Transcript_40449:318-644(+)